jgi:hypothetical protein
MVGMFHIAIRNPATEESYYKGYNNDYRIKILWYAKRKNMHTCKYSLTFLKYLFLILSAPSA